MNTLEKFKRRSRILSMREEQVRTRFTIRPTSNYVGQLVKRRLARLGNRFALAMLSFTLLACGQTGPLFLPKTPEPPKPRPEPIQTEPKKSETGKVEPK
jgi:predicted small lipoprotein YifL